MEIGDLPMTTTGGKPTRMEALKYYRRAAEHYEIEMRLYETDGRIATISDTWTSAFFVHTEDPI